MKKLIYVDNDNYNVAKSDLERYVLPSFHFFGRVDKDILQNSEIQIMHDFYKSQNRDELYKIFFDKNNVILTWSVYTANSMHNSKMQFLHFLRVAGGADVKDCNYIDVSGEAYKSLNHTILFEDVRYLYKILTGIENNNIISVLDGQFQRLRLCFDGKDAIKKEPIDIQQILGL